uniref:Uncharacterized protein n=1 Tax=Heterorhabditis bacteriophora TaxID=37862 RepID=A0A1I7WAJ0_HETBA
MVIFIRGHYLDSDFPDYVFQTDFSQINITMVIGMTFPLLYSILSIIFTESLSQFNQFQPILSHRLSSAPSDEATSKLENSKKDEDNKNDI